MKQGVHRVNRKRIRPIRYGTGHAGPVVYWMSRDQRVKDNWALLFAQDIAFAQRMPLIVIFCMLPRFLNATIRQYAFMMKGLEELKIALKGKARSLLSCHRVSGTRNSCFSSLTHDSSA
jgi:deoxyribodipyrimidine photo-lyase